MCFSKAFLIYFQKSSDKLQLLYFTMFFIFSKYERQGLFNKITKN